MNLHPFRDLVVLYYTLCSESELNRIGGQVSLSRRRAYVVIANEYRHVTISNYSSLLVIGYEVCQYFNCLCVRMRAIYLPLHLL